MKHKLPAAPRSGRAPTPRRPRAGKGPDKPHRAHGPSDGRGTAADAGDAAHARSERRPGTAGTPSSYTRPEKRHDGSSLVISPLSGRFVEAGHCWVTRDRETGDTQRFRPGDIVDLVTSDGTWVARALVDPDARVVARILSTDRRVHVDEGLARARALEALELRDALRVQATMYRLVHGEGDGLPGVAVDRYGDYLVAQLYTEAARWLAELTLEALMSTGRFAGAYLKVLPRDRRSGVDEAPGRWVAGEPGPESLILEEGGLRFQVRPFDGLSTGIFLDQRENRARIAALARGRRVLNAFAYTGGFSVACAREGATVDTLDLSSKVLEQARDNFSLNGRSLDTHRFIAADAFPFLSQATGQYEVIILDPPTFSTSRGNVWSPGRLTELNALAMGALVRGGLLVSFSNFAALGEADLLEAVRTAAREVRRALRLVAALQAGPDFPWLPGFPESRHLKGVIAYLS